MLLIAFIGLRHMEAGQRRLSHVVNQEMAKAQAAGEMRFFARERTTALHRMLFLTDPFDRDEQFIIFNEMAGNFVAARERLMATALSEEERALLKRLGTLTAVAAPLQEEAAALVAAGRVADAWQFLIETATPAQDRTLDVLSRLQRLSEQHATSALAEASTAHQRDRTATMTLSTLVLLLGVGIAVGVLRSKAKGDQALHDEKERALVTLGAMGDAVIRTDRDGRIEYLNPCAEHMTGWRSAEACSRRAKDIIYLIRDPGHGEPLDLIRDALATGEPCYDLYQNVLIGRQGERYSVEASTVPIRDHAGAIVGTVTILHDVTEVRTLSLELVYHATHDSMTGLLNRREFDRRVNEAMDATRNDGRSYVLCYIDLDLFKAINDVCGHLAGDELLRQIGTQLHKAVRPEDAVARIGGDEFAILLEDCPLDNGVRIGDEIRRVIHQYRFIWDNKSFDVAASIGIVGISPSAGALQDLLRTADDACRRAKAEGRNRVHVADHLIAPANTQLDISWAETLGAALVEDRFSLYGQWVYPLDGSTKRPSHCEVLLRLQGPHGEVVSPAAFLPAAERYHMMPAIDRWVVRHALSRLGPQADDHVFYNINLSGQSLCDPDFLDFVLSQFDESALPPERVCFEITETAAISNMTSASGFISRLSEIGCAFALDDFGSGLCSFGYLKNMRVRYIKIDGVFVRDMENDPVDRAMVWCINEMARVMGIKTIAEYVESEAVLQELRDIGVDYGQGWFMARPWPLQELLPPAAAVQ
jgi:diguanylate cyclase (GGDEF)-like protein/PAS domain S-box-containing protein